MNESRDKPGRLEQFTRVVTSDGLGQVSFLALSAAFVRYTYTVSTDWIDSSYSSIPIGELVLGTAGTAVSLCAAYSFRSRRRK